jgi:predicted ArsR family transcriptional regulator
VVLELLKRRGAMSAVALGAALGVSPVGVRRHLDGLLADGLVAVDVERRPVGRPTSVYRLTQAGDETFPQAYAALAETVLSGVAEELGPGGVERALVRRAEALAEPLAARLAAADIATAARALAGVQDRGGFLAEASSIDDSTALLVEHNCPVARVVGTWPQVCAAELAMFERAVGERATVERVTHIASGDRTCSYLLRARAGGASPAGSRRE